MHRFFSRFILWELSILHVHSTLKLVDSKLKSMRNLVHFTYEIVSFVAFNSWTICFSTTSFNLNQGLIREPVQYNSFYITYWFNCDYNETRRVLYATISHRDKEFEERMVEVFHLNPNREQQNLIPFFAMNSCIQLPFVLHDMKKCRWFLYFRKHIRHIRCLLLFSAFFKIVKRLYYRLGFQHFYSLIMLVHEYGIWYLFSFMSYSIVTFLRALTAKYVVEI